MVCNEKWLQMIPRHMELPDWEAQSINSLWLNQQISLKCASQAIP